ncbi:MAG: hypothetical protein ACLVLI_04780, partial [Aedoeadaptatus pacaensis]
MNEYEAFSLIYDAVMANYDYDEAFRWVKEVAGEGDRFEILEMAMGTGKLAEKLTELGNVT